MKRISDFENSTGINERRNVSELQYITVTVDVCQQF